MEDLIPFLIVLAIAVVLSGPLALILSLSALRRLREIRRELEAMMAASPSRQRAGAAPAVKEPPSTPRTAEPEPAAETPAGHVVEDSLMAAESAAASPPPDTSSHPQVPFETIVPSSAHLREVLSLEQRIGTRWVLIAGIITVIFAVGFFLKYAYENQWIGPLGRVLIAATGGLIALLGGELTRRRGYDFVAKGVTALGFAILYATVFAAHRWYDLIGSVPAYALAIGITVAAMLYAVILNEIAIALLSLIGGYLTPVVLSTGENLPTLLFSYVLILSAGAMLCAYRRKWSAVNVVAFIGTYLLYTGWFERFYRPALRSGPTEQLAIALFWLAAFFLVFLLLPVLHTLLRRVRSEVQDTVLVLANAAVVFYYLWTVLIQRHENWLALCSIVMGTAYLALMGLVFIRCRADRDLLNALLLAALAFVTVAVPLYFEMRAVAVIWAVEGFALSATGLRYRSKLTQLAAGAVLALATGKLLFELPMHTESFRPVLNQAFGAWCFVAIAMLACHVLYRMDVHLDADVRQMAIQGLYAAGLLLLLVAISLELWYHDELNPTAAAGPGFLEQMPLVFAVFLLLFAARPLRPRGPLCPTLAATIAVVGSVCLVLAYPQFHRGRFMAFVTMDFVRGLALVAAVFAGAWLLRRAESEQEGGPEVPTLVALVGILALWLLMTEEVWFYYESRKATEQWRLLAHMYISFLWAAYATGLMVIGFWRRVRLLRYLALGLFVLLLAKIFLVDTRTLDTVYRIAGFLVTGLVLVGVSYLYQYLKKTGFFETMLAEKRQ